MTDTTAPDAVQEFRLPSLGSDMDSGTVLRWHVDVGDVVHRGDVLLDVDTEKSEIEVEIWHDGVVAALLVEPGTEVPVGTALALLDPLRGDERAAPSAAAAAPVGPPAQPTPPPAPAPPSPPAVQTDPARAADGELTITPRTVWWPTSPRDTPPEHSAPSPAATPARRATGERSSRRRNAIADLMSRANSEIPHYHLWRDVDFSRAADWLATQNEHRSSAERILPAALIIAAVGRAAARHRELDGHWLDGGFVPAAEPAVGVAIHLRSGGLVAPAIADAHTRSVADLMAALRDLVDRARAGRLRSTEVTSATLTVTNLGDQGTDAVLGVIHPPQVALVGVGRIAMRPVVVDDDVVARPMVTITLAADHRATDGHTGARFLKTLDQLLQNPEEI